MLNVLAVSLVCVIFSSVAHAQLTRTFVSGVGDDANMCSRTAPCQTLAGALSKTTAGGEINVLDAGGYGAVTINKAITILAPGVPAGVLVSGTNGVVVSAGASDIVSLVGLDIDGLGSSTSGSTIRIANCDIYNNTTGVNVALGAVGQRCANSRIIGNVNDVVGNMTVQSSQ